MSKNTGGPAFPSKRMGVNNEPDIVFVDGMTLRDYFIAHAPPEPQPWFSPKMPNKPGEPCHDLISGLSKELQEEARSWKNDPCFDVSPELLVFAEAWKDYWKRDSEWDADFQKQRYIQWPGAWADAQLEERDRTNQ